MLDLAQTQGPRYVSSVLMVWLQGPNLRSLLLLLCLQAVVSLLLSAGANPNARDNLGGSPLLEAVKAGHMSVVHQLTAAGGTLQLSVSELSSALCSMVLQGQADLLRRYIAAGADVGAWDYDRRTALHIAAAEGKLDMVRGQ